jgi:hypothetical protein
MLELPPLAITNQLIAESGVTCPKTVPESRAIIRNNKRPSMRMIAI